MYLIWDVKSILGRVYETDDWVVAAVMVYADFFLIILVVLAVFAGGSSD